MTIRSLGVIMMTLVGVGAGAAPSIVVSSERLDAVYKTDETIKFKVDAKELAGPLSYSVASDDQTPSPLPLTGAAVTTKLAHPGFVLVKVSGLTAEGKTIEGLAGAAVSPEELKPSRTAPPDFDAFWDAQVAAQRSAPLEIERKPLPANQLPRNLVGYDVTLKRAGLVATGYLLLPAGAKPKSLPAVANFLGASKLSAEIPAAAGWATLPALSFNLNFHGLPNLRDDNDTATRNANLAKVKGYQLKIGDGREKYPMREIFLRVVMSMDYLRTLPEHDGKHLIAAGGSLGGCQAVVAAALVPEVTFCVSNATAMCDHHGGEQGRMAGWPKLLKESPEAETSAGYFDMANFTPRVHCPTRMAVGFIDTISPPSSTYVAYNMLGCIDKKMYHAVTSGHGPNIVAGKPSVFAYGYDDVKKHCQTK